jgi:predicted ABC-type transport system involved in lysophospholipase L1 biosynthesis ATPase subunit
MMIDPRDEANSEEMVMLESAFSEQLLACLDECARGRRGLFSESVSDQDEGGAWPEAARLRELAVALQSIFAQVEERNALCDEFLDLCTIHGESHPGERRLARAFLERIERGEVGTSTQEERKPW